MAIDLLLDEQCGHGGLPNHVIDRIAGDMGVAHTSLASRFDLAVRHLVRESGPLPVAALAPALADARSFGDAYRLVGLMGSTVAYAVFERALWADTGNRRLADLRSRERSRRQAISESGVCHICQSTSQAAA
jgi:hypothetical protein